MEKHYSQKHGNLSSNSGIHVKARYGACASVTPVLSFARICYNTGEFLESHRSAYFTQGQYCKNPLSKEMEDED